MLQVRRGRPHNQKLPPSEARATIKTEAATRDEIGDAAAHAAMYAAQYALMPTDYAHFALEEMIFDTAASKFVFKNPNLLTNVAPSGSPTVIWGVQQGAPGVRIDDVGEFRDLGEVGIGKGATCNIP